MPYRPMHIYKRQLVMRRSSPVYIGTVRDATELVLSCTKA